MRKPSLNLQKFHSGEVDGQLAMNCSRVEAREYYDMVFRRFVSANFDFHGTEVIA